MNIGDLVRINDLNEPDPKRMIGTVVKNDVHDAQFSKMGDRATKTSGTQYFPKKRNLG